MKWLITLIGGVVIMLLVRQFMIESFYVSTGDMEGVLRKGDYILVNKLPIIGNPGKGRVVLFTSPLLRDTATLPLFLSRCVAMPGDTIQVTPDNYKVNGRLIPRSPSSLAFYFIASDYAEELRSALGKLKIPLKSMSETTTGSLSVRLSSFQAFQVREELSAEAGRSMRNTDSLTYSVIVPRKGRAYRLDENTLPVCKEAILSQAGDRAVFKGGKLYMDGRETSFFFFESDYYWMLSDNPDESVDSRHLGFIPSGHVIGNVWLRWFGVDKKPLFKLIR